jgi:hypothetical protein
MGSVIILVHDIEKRTDPFFLIFPFSIFPPRCVIRIKRLAGSHPRRLTVGGRRIQWGVVGSLVTCPD